MQLVISLYPWYVKGHWHWLSSSISENALPGQSYLEGLQLIAQYIHDCRLFIPWRLFMGIAWGELQVCIGQASCIIATLQLFRGTKCNFNTISRSHFHSNYTSMFLLNKWNDCGNKLASCLLLLFSQKMSVSMSKFSKWKIINTPQIEHMLIRAT